uniref:Endonuclease III domain-containing protein n=1 Tax=candidate division WOR-3 bacterium TaxID=2052148 RepID=A0A7V3ZXH4_UNCW3
MKRMKGTLEKLFDLLYSHFGPQHWWPGETELEIIVGAVLTQNTSWKNVEKAIENLKRAGKMDLNALHLTNESEVAKLIRPSGFFKLKASRLKNIVDFLFRAGGIEALKEKDLHELRETLLRIRGIGPETADSILLYALGKPVFVVDAYTRRILKRIGLIQRENVSYDEIQQLFMKNLPQDVQLYNEYHALFVKLGKTYCTKRTPNCNSCPALSICKYGKEMAYVR